MSTVFWPLSIFPLLPNFKQGRTVLFQCMSLCRNTYKQGAISYLHWTGANYSALVLWKSGFIYPCHSVSSNNNSFPVSMKPETESNLTRRWRNPITPSAALRPRPPFSVFWTAPRLDKSLHTSPKFRWQMAQSVEMTLISLSRLPTSHEHERTAWLRSMDRVLQQVETRAQTQNRSIFLRHFCFQFEKRARWRPRPNWCTLPLPILA